MTTKTDQWSKWIEELERENAALTAQRDALREACRNLAEDLEQCLGMLRANGGLRRDDAIAYRSDIASAKAALSGAKQ